MLKETIEIKGRQIELLRENDDKYSDLFYKGVRIQTEFNINPTTNNRGYRLVNAIGKHYSLAECVADIDRATSDLLKYWQEKTEQSKV